MYLSFKESLPAELIAHVTAGCGEPGREWIESLESTVRSLEERWSILVEKPFPAGEFNYVSPATREDGEPVVLKIAPPWSTVEIFGEADYLRYRDGSGCVRLLDVDHDCRAILLERLFPGVNLSEQFHAAKPDSLEPAIQVLETILRPVPADSHHITTLDHWFAGLRRFPATDFPRSYATKALDIYDRLSLQSGRTFYLHGDYHPGNIVTAERSPYLAIDPKGIIGHLGYEIAVFLNNYHWWHEADPKIHSILDDAVTRFSTAFEMEEIELREWAFCQMVIGSWWNFADMPELYDGGVVKADIWRV